MANLIDVPPALSPAVERIADAHARHTPRRGFNVKKWRARLVVLHLDGHLVPAAREEPPDSPDQALLRVDDLDVRAVLGPHASEQLVDVRSLKQQAPRHC